MAARVRSARVRGRLAYGAGVADGAGASKRHSVRVAIRGVTPATVATRARQAWVYSLLTVGAGEAGAARACVAGGVTLHVMAGTGVLARARLARANGRLAAITLVAKRTLAHVVVAGAVVVGG